MIEDENDTARLVRLAGPRAPVPADRADRVREAVRGHWRSATRRRIVRRRVMTVVVLCAVASAGSAIVLMRRGEATGVPAVAAHVERVDGTLPLAAGASLGVREWLETGAGARVALRLPDGTSVRLDSGCRMRLLSPALIELAYGGLYVDTINESGGLEIRTAFGTVRDVGTQFETRVTGSVLRLRVRTGVVELRRGDRRDVTARAGTELTLIGNEIESRPVSEYGSEWAWAVTLAPRFDIEGRSLAAFLDYLAREHGWRVRYSDAALARHSSSIILHGSVTGLDPEDALAVVLATSDLTHRLRNGELVVSRRVEGQVP